MKSEWKTQRSQMGMGLSEKGDVKDKGRYMGMTVSLWCLIVLYYFLLSLKHVFVSGRSSNTVSPETETTSVITERKRNTGTK